MITLILKLKTILMILAAILVMPGVHTGFPADANSGQILGGPVDAPIRMEVFSDFQCSACRAFYLETIRPILKDYASKGKACVIYFDYPLASHTYSRKAACYAQAAHSLGHEKWLAVLDALYENQADWSASGDVGTTIARVLSAEDFKQLEEILQDPLINQAVEQGISLGIERGINATPTYFLYYIGKEQKIEGALPYVALKQFFDRIVK